MCFIPKEQYYKHDAARLNSFVLSYARKYIRTLIRNIEKEYNYEAVQVHTDGIIFQRKIMNLLI